MTDETDYLSLPDEALLDQCNINIHRTSGPGGQHRNKVSSACRLRHRPTGITASAGDSRSQHTNRRMVLQRLRMNIACQHRRPLDPQNPAVPPVVGQCIFSARAKSPQPARRLQIGRKDHRFWKVAAFLLDLLAAHAGRVAPAAAAIAITTSNLTSVFRSDRHLFGAAQAIRKASGRKPLQ